MYLYIILRKGWYNFSGFIRFEGGFGTRFQFWDYWWCRERALKEIPWFIYAGPKDGSFSSRFVELESAGGGVGGVVESDSVGCYLLRCSTKLRRDVEDTICWVPIKSKLFEVDSYYKALHIGSLRRVFGRLKFLQKWLSSLGLVS